MNNIMDKILIKDLLLSGIIGINPNERIQKQDVLINLELACDTTRAGKSDDIQDCVNYRTVTKRIIAHIEQAQRFTLEALAADIANLCLDFEGVESVHLTVEKPGALRFARSVGVEITREKIK
jgi:FolB domain-containing protein